MSATKLKPFRPDQKTKEFFLSSLRVAIPDAITADAKPHAFTCSGEPFSYVAGYDAGGAFVVSVRAVRTYRLPAELEHPKLQCIDGGKK